MSLTRFLKNIKYHQSQPDRPVLSANELKQLFDQAGVDIKDYINETLLNEIENELSTKMAKAGGTISGTVNMADNKITFSDNGNIEFKENGYGNKFRIIPDFSGEGDENKLLIQGITGGEGEDSNDWVTLAHITAQNGNIFINGTLTGTITNAIKWNNFINDLTASNTSGTRLVVLNGDKLQYREIGNIFSGYFQELKGNITIGANTNCNTLLNYPAGFTKENCYIVAVGIQVNENKGYNWKGTFSDSASLLMNVYKKYINTEASGIRVVIENANTSQKTFNYKILLMKI